MCVDVFFPFILDIKFVGRTMAAGVTQEEGHAGFPIHLVGVNDSTTVSSAWGLASVSMHYSQGNGVHTPLSRLVLYPRSVCLFVLVIVCVWSTHGTAMCCRGR